MTDTPIPPSATGDALTGEELEEMDAIHKLSSSLTADDGEAIAEATWDMMTLDGLRFDFPVRDLPKFLVRLRSVPRLATPSSVALAGEPEGVKVGGNAMRPIPGSSDVLRGAIATDLPAILRATLPHWSAEDKRWALRALLEEQLAEIASEDGYVTLSRTGDLASVRCHADRLLALLAPTSEET